MLRFLILAPLVFTLANTCVVRAGFMESSLPQGSQPEQAPNNSQSISNQTIADNIVARLRQGNRLKNYRIDVSFQAGLVRLTGFVANPAQHQEAILLVKSVPGVRAIHDFLVVGNQNAVTQTQAVMPTQSGQAPAPNMQEPTPIYQAPPPGVVPNAYHPPRMPPYAWPTYAPYNNYSRVGYPKLYPYNSWPFIGPMYPFPKVPLGWRSIHLTWEDGFWWYGRNSHGNDWWRVRHW